MLMNSVVNIYSYSLETYEYLNLTIANEYPLADYSLVGLMNIPFARLNSLCERSELSHAVCSTRPTTLAVASIICTGRSAGLGPGKGRGCGFVRADVGAASTS